MALGLLGRKIGMTQVFDQEGVLIPVTIIQAGPCPVLQLKESGKHGYGALQVGFDPKPSRKANKPEKGLFKKLKIDPVRIIREFRVEDASGYEVGQKLDVSVFDEGELVDVSGVTKGRGFTGSVKRWHTHRGPETHGSHYHRRVGSMGGSSDPSRVYKGKRLPGQYGNKKRTVTNLKVVKLVKDKNLILVKGSVPGRNDGYVMIRKKEKKAVKK